MDLSSFGNASLVDTHITMQMQHTHFTCSKRSHTGCWMHVGVELGISCVCRVGFGWDGGGGTLIPPITGTHSNQQRRQDGRAV